MYLYGIFKDHTNLLEHALPDRIQKKIEATGLDEEIVRTYYCGPEKMLNYVAKAIGRPEYKLQTPLINLKYESQKIELKTKILGAYPEIKSAALYTEYAKFLFQNGLHELHVDLSAKTNPVQAVVDKTIKAIIREHPAPERISLSESVARINQNILKDYYKPYAEVLTMRLVNLEQLCKVSNFEEIASTILEDNNLMDRYEDGLESVYNLYQIFPEKRDTEMFGHLEFLPTVQISYNLVTPQQEEFVSCNFYFLLNLFNNKFYCRSRTTLPSLSMTLMFAN